jgi:hypothetical protein
MSIHSAATKYTKKGQRVQLFISATRSIIIPLLRFDKRRKERVVRTKRK